MMDHQLQHSALPVRVASPNATRVLLMCDSTNRLSQLNAALMREDLVIDYATSLAELRQACRRGHQLTIIDVSADLLIDALKLLRSSRRHADVSILVEASRLAGAKDMAGILSQYRAMPCFSGEIIKLARARLGRLQRTSFGRKML